MVGEIYKVTNLVNGKVYIGKTYIGYINRWKKHVDDSTRKDKVIDTKFYRAIRKYGHANFEIELIGTYEKGVLEEKEIEYIDMYDSYRNGYNSTLGGDGSLKYEYDENTIIEAYSQGATINEITRNIGTKSSRVVSNIVKSNGSEIYTTIKAILLEQYDKDWNFLRRFDSKSEAHKWLVENYRGNMKRSTAYYNIKKAIESGGIAFGFHWLQVGERELDRQGKIKTNKKYRVSGVKDGKYIVKDEVPLIAARYLIDNGYTKSKDAYKVSYELVRLDKQRRYGINWEVYTI